MFHSFGLTAGAPTSTPGAAMIDAAEMSTTRANLSCFEIRTVVEDAMLQAMHRAGRLTWDELLEVAFEALEDVVHRGVSGSSIVSHAVFLLYSHGEADKLTTSMQQVTEVARDALEVLISNRRFVLVAEGQYVGSAVMWPPVA